MKLSSSCTRWQHRLQTILTEESLSPQEQADLHAHLIECSECARLNEQRLTLLSALRAQATAAQQEPEPVRSANSMARASALLQTFSKQRAPILSLRSKGRQKRRLFPILKLVGKCVLVLFAWWLLLTILVTLFINFSIHQPLSGAPAEQEMLIQKTINANAVSLNVLGIAACAGAAVSLGLLLGKHLIANAEREHQDRSLDGNIIIVFHSEKGQVIPQTLYLKSLDGKPIQRFARVYVSQTGQLQAHFPLVPPGRYTLRNFSATRERIVSVRPGQTITTRWDETEWDTTKEEPSAVHIIVLDTKDEQPPAPYIIKEERKNEQSLAPQRTPRSDQHPEHPKYLTRDIKV